MDLDAKNFAILTVLLSIVIGLLWEFFADWSDTFDDFWEDLDWKDEVNDEDQRAQPKRKRKK